MPIHGHPRIRIDRLLVERGLFESRAKAQAAIAAGRVTADDVLIAKPSQDVSAAAILHAEPAHPYVSRGGVKLAAALDHFRCDPMFDPRGRVCLDVGASTGGFTEVLLARGARRVYAVDVGRGQLHPRLRARPEIVSIEETDIRTPRSGAAAGAARLRHHRCELHLAQARAAGGARARCKRRRSLLALIKPQFEAGRRHVKKGIVRDPLVHAAVCDDIASFVASRGWHVGGIVPSPISGGDGNREFFIARAARLSTLPLQPFSCHGIRYGAAP